MWRREYGMTRRDMRGGSGREVEPEHYDEVLGASEFYIYLHAGAKMKGYQELKAFLEAEGCQVEYPGYSSLLPNKSYTVIAITRDRQTISDAALRRAHRWAHHHNFLHSFFKPF